MLIDKLLTRVSVYLQLHSRYDIAITIYTGMVVFQKQGGIGYCQL